MSNENEYSTVYMELCAYSHYSNVRTNSIPFLLLLRDTAVKLLPLCTLVATLGGCNATTDRTEILDVGAQPETGGRESPERVH